MVANTLNFSKLIVDYNRSVEDVYSSLVHYMLFSTKSLNILSPCHRRSSHITRTWVADWTTISFYEKGFLQSGGLLTSSISGRQSLESFHASKGEVAVATFSPDLSALYVKGFRVASVAGSMTDLKGPWPGLHVVLSNKIVLIELLNNWVKNGFYKTLEVARKALWAVTVGGMREGDELGFSKWRAWLDNDEPNLDLWTIALAVQISRTLFYTSDGKPGKGWSSVRQRDLVCIILGCDVPLVLRQTGDYYKLIGDCYVDGIMQGEAMKYLEEGKLNLETFEIH
ncbi:hypothetical protein B7463_g10850, partial [Scytalidium lignicola]